MAEHGSTRRTLPPSSLGQDFVLNIPAKEATKAKSRKALVGVVALQVAGLAMVVGGIAMASSGAQASLEVSAQTEEVLVQARSERDAVSAAQRETDALPSAEQVRRNGDAALKAAEAVATKQNALLLTQGRPSLEDVPTESEPEPGTQVRPLTEEERMELALEGRGERQAQLLRETTPLFETGAPSPTAWWTERSTDVDLAGWSWSAAGGGWSDEDGTLNVVWTLSDETGSVRAVIHSQFDPATRKLAAPTHPEEDQ